MVLGSVVPIRDTGQVDWIRRTVSRLLGLGQDSSPLPDDVVETVDARPAVSAEGVDRPIRHFDLSAEREATFALLDDTRAWKERAVHEFVLRDSDHVSVSSSYQVRLPIELVQRFEPSARAGDLVRLALPFGVRPKQLLLDVDFQGFAGNAISLLLRDEASLLQAAYLERLLSDAAMEARGLDALWIGVSAYTPSAWREHQARVDVPRRDARRDSGTHRVRALVAYMTADLEFAIDETRVRRWLAELEPARLLLTEALAEGEDAESSSECMLLAIPFMPSRPDDLATIDELVCAFAKAVQVMPVPAREVLAEYGRRWEAIVDTKLPAGHPCSVKLLEQRPWVDAPSAVMTQEIAFSDATTTHVEIRAADLGVVIGDPEITSLAGDRAGYGVGDAIRETGDAIAIYASDPDRPYLARISVRARVRLGQRLLIWWLLLLIGMAAGVALALPEAADLVDSLALLTFPLTLAGAVVLSRESSPLAERLLRRWRVALVVAIGALWIITLGRLLLNGDVSWAESLWDGLPALGG